MPEGRRPEGTALPERIYLPRTKTTEVQVAISLYIIAQRDPIYIYIYNKCPTFSLSSQKNLLISTFTINMYHAANTKINDAVTNRQFKRFLANADIDSR